MEFTVWLETNNKVTQEKGECKGNKWYQGMVQDAIRAYTLGGSDLIREVRMCVCL